ncbi:MAG: WYL domain-containing protein [Planctomycetota bacterium]
MKSSRVSRVIQILTTLQTGRKYSAAELSRMFGVSRRTLFRDLKELQDIGIRPQCTPLHPGPTSADEQRRYTLAHEQFLPPVNLNLQEALGLLLLVHKMRGQIQLPFKNAALLAAMKIESNLPPRVRHYCEYALAKISTKASPQAPAPKSPGLDNTFSSLQSAIAQRRKVRIRYDSLFDGGTIDCDLAPYHLFYNQRAWYVVGHSSVHKNIRTFKLNRIQNASMLEDQFEDGDSFDLADYIGRAWSMIPEGRIYNIRLRFSPKVANNVAEVLWHNTQKVARNPDSSATLDFRVDGLGEITWWILGYGDQVEVLAPAALRKRIIDIAQKMTEINNGQAESR